MEKIIGCFSTDEVAAGEIMLPVWDILGGVIDFEGNLPRENGEITAEIATHEAENDNSLEGDPDSIIGLTIE